MPNKTSEPPVFCQITERIWVALEHVTGIEFTGTIDAPASITIHLIDGRQVYATETQADLLGLMSRLKIYD